MLYKLGEEWCDNMVNSNAEAKRVRDAQKRQNAFNNRRYEKIVATDKNYNTIAYSNITVLLEDDGYAFDFVSQLLKKVYNYLNFDLIGAHGEGGIKHIVSFINADLLIVVYDKSNNIKMIQNIDIELNNFKHRNPNATIVKIMPKAFEEIILSYAYLQELINTNDKQGIKLLNTINDYMTGKTGNYSLANFVMNPARVNDDMILEDWIERLTSGTQYYCGHSPSKISTCWLNECESCKSVSNTCNLVTPATINNYIPKSKIEFIILNSLGYYITKAIDDYTGNRYRKTICNLLNERDIMEVK